MSVLQYPATKRFSALLAVAVFTLFVLSAASRASAESTVYSNPQVNVFLQFAKGKGPLSSAGYSGYFQRVQIYKHGEFVSANEFEMTEFDQLSPFLGETSPDHWKEVGFLLKLEPYEKVIAIQVSYRLNNGRQAPFNWDGKGVLPMRRYFGKAKASLEYVDVGLHSPELEDQIEEPEPKPTGIR